MSGGRCPHAPNAACHSEAWQPRPVWFFGGPSPASWGPAASDPPHSRQPLPTPDHSRGGPSPSAFAAPRPPLLQPPLPVLLPFTAPLDRSAWGSKLLVFGKSPAVRVGARWAPPSPSRLGVTGRAPGGRVCYSWVAGVTPLTGKGLSLRTGSLPSSWVLGVSLCLLSGPLSHAPFPMAQVGELPTSMPLRRWTGSGHCRHREAGPQRLNLKCPLCLGFCGAVGSGGPRTHAGEQQGQGRRPAGVTRGSHSFRPARRT